MHIGLIGGIGPAATEFYYRGLIDRHAAAGTTPDLTIVHADVREMAANLASNNAQRQAEIFACLIRRLAAAGAELAAVTSMGGHFCIRELEAISPLPLLNAIPEVDAAIRQRKLRTIGLIGTRNVMESGLYGGITAARIVRPEGDAFEQVHTAYITMAGVGRVTDGRTADPCSRRWRRRRQQRTALGGALAASLLRAHVLRAIERRAAAAGNERNARLARAARARLVAQLGDGLRIADALAAPHA